MLYRTTAGKVLSVVGVVLRLIAIFGATVDLIVFLPVRSRLRLHLWRCSSLGAG